MTGSALRHVRATGEDANFCGVTRQGPKGREVQGWRNQFANFMPSKFWSVPGVWEHILRACLNDWRCDRADHSGGANAGYQWVPDMLRADGHEILVLAPHPDDETFGCGGTLRLLANAGAAIDVAYLTRGELGSETPEAATAESRAHLAERRTHEARHACQLLGVRDVMYLSGRDGYVAEQPWLAGEIGNLLAHRHYQRVFCPWQEDAHPDHQATFRWLGKALRKCPIQTGVWLYEVWTPLVPSTVVPIDSTIETKAAAAHAHRSQLACLDYLSGFRGLAAYRALRCPGTKFAEAFQVTTSERLREAVAHD